MCLQPQEHWLELMQDFCQCPKEFLTSKQCLGDYKNFLISEWLISFKIKISEKNKTKNLKIKIKKNSVNFKEKTWIWIRIHFFPVRIQDPDPHQN